MFTATLLIIFVGQFYCSDSKENDDQTNTIDRGCAGDDKVCMTPTPPSHARTDISVDKIHVGQEAPSGIGDFFKATDDWKLYYESWAPPSVPKVAPHVVFVPGIHESAETVKVRRLAAGMIAAGAHLHCLEPHGHGHSLEHEGRAARRGRIVSLDLYIKHTLDFLKHLLSHFGQGAQFVLVGHSIGGAAVAVAAATANRLGNTGLAGAVLLAPAVGLSAPPPFFQSHILLPLLSFFAPEMELGFEEHPEDYMPTGVPPPGRNFKGKALATTLNALMSACSGFKARMERGELVGLGGLPYIVMAAADDDRTIPDMCRRIAAIGTRGRFIELPSGTDNPHNPFSTKGWQDNVRIVVSFVSEVTQKM